MATPDRLGDFEIIEEIGRGGFGVVYRARQLSLDRPVAVKVLFRHLIHTQDQISRFEREARAAARLDHPAIVSVYAWGQDKDDFYIAQRLVGHGRTLADEITALKTMGAPPKGHFRRVAEVLAHIAEGLQQAHDRGIVHRDVKPSNILLDEHDLPCLGDFGLAKMEGGSLDISRTGDFAGSPYFMSPEQADSKRGVVDHRSDVYSLGVTMFELLTLTQPFQGDTPHEIVRKILGEDPRRPRRIESRVPQDLETICLHAMEKNPALRYPSALEFAHDLRAFLDGEPISAEPIGTVRRALRSMRRHREPVAWSLLLALLVGGGTWAIIKESSSSQKVDRAQAESMVQGKHVEEIGQITDDFNEKIQAAAAQQDPAKVTALVQEQQLSTSMLNENYAWVSKQLSQMGDTVALKSVATGIATGGLYGGLQNLQQLLLTRKVAKEGDVLMSEVNRRMSDLAAHLLQQHDGDVAAASSPHVDAPLMLGPVAGKLYLLIRGQLMPMPPVDAPLPGGAAPAAPRLAAPDVLGVPAATDVPASASGGGTSRLPPGSAAVPLPGRSP